MKIGIIGAGHIGKTLALRLAKAGHEVKVANSGAPSSIDPSVLVTSAVGATVQQVVDNRDVIILSIPLDRIPELAPIFVAVPLATTVIDTSNYIPLRDGKIGEIERGQVESLWVVEQLGRPVAKAWNAVLAHTFAHKHKPSQSTDRIAIPVSADRDIDRQITMELVDQTGFDAFYAGKLAESWRQHPGASAYCTDLTLKELQSLINNSEKVRISRRRDLAGAAIAERMSGLSIDELDWGFILRINRTLYI